MSKVFLAYKTVDVDRASVVRTKLEALGVPIFIDQKMAAGDNYISAINEELSSAVAVLVLWTEAAVRVPADGEPPNFVLSEAQRGYSRGILVAATFEKMALDHLPVPFNLFQAPNVSDWIQAGALATHREWQKILSALGKKLNRPGLADLAIVLEANDDVLKRKFLKEYPQDPSAHQIADELEAFEREEFETSFSTAKKRIDQRARDSQKKLKSCRDQFEKQIEELRAGRSFMPPKPLDALGDNLGALQNQIEIYEGTIQDERARADKALAEATALKDQLGKTTIGALDTGTKNRQQRNSLVLWSSLSAAVAAVIFGFIGMSVTPGQTDIAHLRSQIAASASENETQRAQIKALRDAAADASKSTNANAALNSQIQGLTSQNQALGVQVKTLQGRADDAAASAAKSSNAAAALNSQINVLAAQNQILQANLAAAHTASSVLSLISQCDALAGYQYDLDRPSSNGYVADQIKDPASAQAICQRTLQTPEIDQITQRRMLLNLARTYVETAPPDYNSYVSNLNKASQLGSSQADYQLGMYYATNNAPQQAWDRIQRSAAAHNLVALNRAAISQIFPDWNEYVITQQALDSGFQYLQQALDAAYYRSYYVAGAAYWTYKNRDTPDRSKAIYYLTVSQCVTDKRNPNAPKDSQEYANYKDGADYYYFKKTGKHITCP